MQSKKTLTHAKAPITVFRTTIPKESAVHPEHHHTAFEITMVIEGNGVYATREREFDFSDGDIFFFGTDEIHWIKELSSSCEFINIHFEPRYIWSDNFGISDQELIKIFFNRKKKSLNKLDCNNPSARSIRDLIFKTEKEVAEKKPEYETMIKIYLVNILVEVVRSFDGFLDNADISYSSQTLRYMEEALKFIDEHLESDLTLEMLSDTAHMSKTYFCGQFKKLNGISPWEYITIKRIEKAVSYIESSDLTKIEIAAKCGYNNTANFYHAFKKVTGKTPGDYKKLSTDILAQTAK